MHTNAIVLAALTTAVLAGLGAILLAWLSSRRPTAAALGAPVVVVAALAAGVAVAARSMLLAANDFRTVLLVLAAGSPLAVLIGVILARRVSAMQHQAERVQAEAERDAEIEQSRRRMIQWLSHDLRTPLSGVRLIAESLQENMIDDPASAYEQLIVEVDRIDGMVEDIAALSRLQGSLEPVRQLVDLDDVVSDAVSAVRPLADARGVNVSATSMRGGPIEIDPGQVSRAVTNIVRNAVQHTPEGGSVEVFTRIVVPPSGRTAEVIVSDGCGGLESVVLQRMFQPGWRADPARRDGGMGLGLAIAQAVARAHDGDVTVVNQPSGHGCSVTARFADPLPA